MSVVGDEEVGWATGCSRTQGLNTKLSRQRFVIVSCFLAYESELLRGRTEEPWTRMRCHLARDLRPEPFVFVVNKVPLTLHHGT